MPVRRRISIGRDLAVRLGGFTLAQNRLLDKADDRPKSKRPARQREIECDEALFERLRDLRKEPGRRAPCPGLCIFGDATLRDMRGDIRRHERPCGDLRCRESANSAVRTAFAAEIAAYLETYPRVEFAARD